jgi:carboxyl-terminal processing protease
MASRTRSYIWVLATVLLCSLVGGMFGPATEVASAATQTEDDISATLKAFSKVYSAIEDNAADKINADRAIYNGAIPGMLRTLDPHSNFFDPRAFQLLREDQRGHYYGVGMSVGPKNNRTQVLEPFTGAPAYKAGIRRGDIIAEVNDKKTDGLTTSEVADLLKGPRGTPVQIKIERLGVDKHLLFNLIRDEISRKSVGDGFWLKPGIAYVDINSFNENTSREMEEELRKLGEANIKGLVLDLRGNPGGLLNEGVEVAGHFLKKNEVVVKHRGRTSPERPYQARRGGGAGKDYPVVVVVDCGRRVAGS